MEYPMQFAGGTEKGKRNTAQADRYGTWDLRDSLEPRRLTIVMWDQAFLFRHYPGGSYEDYDRVLDETIERGYNTLRLDPMPNWIDLSTSDTSYEFGGSGSLMPWGGDKPVRGPMGRWTEDFMQKVLKRKLNYTLSAWWLDGGCKPAPIRIPASHTEASGIWLGFLAEWKRHFGFDGCVYVDICNEVPYFMGTLARLKKQFGDAAWDSAAFSPELAAHLAADINGGLRLLRREFPELRFTASLHGDPRWLDVPLELDCQDIHFYTDADPRWTDRTRFGEFMPRFFKDTEWHKEFNERCARAGKAMIPMARARQRDKIRQFAEWGDRRGMPLTTSESWSSWYYIDSPDLDWGWLLEYAEHTVRDALDFRMWGWTPHNYCQPQFANWKNVKWHRKLTSRFLKG